MSEHTASEIGQALKACLAGLIQGSSDVDLVTDDTNLFDVGLDSMNMTELMLRIEERFDLLLMPEELSADLFSRFDRLVSFVQGKMAA